MPEQLLGILPVPPDPLRYQYFDQDEDSVTGMLPALIPHGARLLEVGCGVGAMLQFFRQVPRVVALGIEPNPDRARAAATLGLDVQCGLLSPETASAIGTFDVVVFADVLEHLHEPADLLVIARKMLRPGGFVLASIPNVAHWTIRLALLRGTFDYQPSGLMDATHLRWFTMASARRLFESAGFSHVEFSWTTAPFLREYDRLPRKRRLLRALVRRYPGLFGFQHVIKASAEPFVSGVRNA